MSNEDNFQTLIYIYLYTHIFTENVRLKRDWQLFTEQGHCAKHHQYPFFASLLQLDCYQ